MKDTYTKEEVIELLMKERQRAVDIAYSFMDKNKDEYKWKKFSRNDYAFISENIADECRLIGNSISGLNALSAPTGETIKDCVIRDLEKYESNSKE